ncbi:NAD(P)H-quinone oxidoreductase [Pigmentiphaga humi]|nr:NAD(P)H-quinone oxidoreductase [Pigmentiphaga humi]
MQYIDYGQGRGPEVLKPARCPRPEPGPGDVLIRVLFAGVNRPDVAQRIGRYPPPPGASPIIGLEVSGTVEAVGQGVEQWRAGDQVCALTPGGGYAEYCVAPAAHCLPIPRGMPLSHAAALPETCFTVWDNVFRRARLQAGETLLVHGGSGGIGTTAIQMGKAMGARVIATAGSAEKVAHCLAQGADLAVDYREQDFVAEALAYTGSQGVDVVLDMVAGTYLQRNLDCLAMDGRIAAIAFMGGAQATLDITTMLRRRATLTGSTLRPRTVAQKAAIADELRRHWWPRLDAGLGMPVVQAVLDWSEAAQAHRTMEDGALIGKLVLAVGQP